MHADRNLLSDELVQAVDSLAEAFAARSIRHAHRRACDYDARSPRFIQDVDFLLDVPQVALPGLLDDLVERGFTLDPAVVIKEYVQRRVTAFRFGEVRIDWLKPVLRLYARTLADAHPWNGTRDIRSTWPRPRGSS